ncbi:AraC family transcriptional regulator [Aliarcobacter skirrowii]|jgi:AraC family transcriptional regulator|uniref:AraC family transcriptional regulator n=3 Tax=Aliarcobacter skirrowii TaxID=28200 RepID=A0AAD0SJS8_9BACT|nr:GyrI-like domain-containing protein [Aliarcobacter skirrowii]AXX84021.1 transcriptional regulator, AraC family (GyrI domain) [Aliarcobacter skirrowii CCUG 10374]AZL53191.1 AraC family transcriptional regulator [Aliarcobacter skirrowii]KAB0621790.1 AraC family transcriptional regulator [Aliarcobacter skirrowii CCUG 10374]MDD2507678.1 helix-turn-helix domain-containing protein [Aliarcobacter skirrowii]MDD3025249.1 helix-turn-helix domain-containing protein [Aliarcobacter skirrowii]
MKKETLEKRTNIANDIMYYIYTHIDTNIDIEELSIDLGISKFHMHRVFKEIFGRNIYESIKSIRLQKASNLLLTNKYSTISSIVNSCGYSSQSSFIKIFKERFGMSPKEWKNGGYKEYSNNIINQSKFSLKSKTNFDSIVPTIVKNPAIESYYIRNRGYDKNIELTWQKLETWLLTNNIKQYKKASLFHDNPTITPLEECQYIACIIVEDDCDVKSDRIPKFNIAEGVYARFDLKCKNEDLLPFIQWVYHEWLPKSEYETTTKPSYAIYENLDFVNDNLEFSFFVSIDF